MQMRWGNRAFLVMCGKEQEKKTSLLLHYLELVQFNPQVTQVYIKWDDRVSAAPIRQLVGTKRSFIKQATDNVEKVCTYLSVPSLTHLLISVSLSLASVHHHSRTNASVDNEVGNSFWKNVCICRRTTAWSDKGSTIKYPEWIFPNRIINIVAIERRITYNCLLLIYTLNYYYLLFVIGRTGLISFYVVFLLKVSPFLVIIYTALLQDMYANM